LKSRRKNKNRRRWRRRKGETGELDENIENKKKGEAEEENIKKMAGKENNVKMERKMENEEKGRGRRGYKIRILVPSCVVLYGCDLPLTC
jgi:hypothetical protein